MTLRLAALAILTIVAAHRSAASGEAPIVTDAASILTGLRHREPTKGEVRERGLGSPFREGDTLRQGIRSDRLLVLVDEKGKPEAYVYLAVTKGPSFAREMARVHASSCSKISDKPDTTDVVGDVSYSNPAYTIFCRRNIFATLLRAPRASQDSPATSIGRKIVVAIDNLVKDG